MRVQTEISVLGTFTVLIKFAFKPMTVANSFEIPYLS